MRGPFDRAGQVMMVRQARYRALITLDRPDGDTPREYVNRRRGLMVEAHCPGPPGSVRFFPAEIYRDENKPLRPGDHAVVTITVTDEDAGAFFGAGQQFRL